MASSSIPAASMLFRLRGQRSARVGAGHFHRDRVPDGDRVSLHLRPEGDRPRQGPAEGAPAGGPFISGPAAGCDARVWQDPPRDRQLSSARIHSIPDCDTADHFSDRAAGSLFRLVAPAASPEFSGSGPGLRPGRANDAALQLPPELSSSAPAVHVPKDKE